MTKQWVISRNPVYILRAYQIQQNLYLTYPLNHALYRKTGLWGSRGPREEHHFLYAEAVNMCEYVADLLQCVCRLPTAQEMAYACGIRENVFPESYACNRRATQKGPNLIQDVCRGSLWCTWLEEPAIWKSLYTIAGTLVEYDLESGLECELNNDWTACYVVAVMQERIQ